MQRRSQWARGGHTLNDEKFSVPETLKSAIKSTHWKVALKLQVQLTPFYPEKDVSLYIEERSLNI